MRTSTILTTAALLFPAGPAAFADGPAACAAQTGADSKRERLLLSAAIEEVRRSPFHAGAPAVPPRGVALARTATGDTFASLSLQTGSQEQPDDTAVPGFVVPLTFVASLASHFAFYYGGNILLAGLPVPVVAGPSALNGVHPGAALGASLLGYLPVALLYWRFVVFRPRGGGPIILAGSLIHAGIVVGLVNRSAFGRK